MDGMGRNRAIKPYQRTGHKGWWVTVYNEHGRRQRLKAGATYEDAVVFRARYVANVESIKSGHITRRQVEVAEAAKSDVNRVVKAYLADLEARASAGHVKETHRVIDRFIEQAKVYSLADITLPVVKRWLAKQSSQKHALAYVRAFCKWCIDEHKLTDNPTMGITVRTEPKRPARALLSLIHI